jgi:hypothetical protein
MKKLHALPFLLLATFIGMPLAQAGSQAPTLDITEKLPVYLSWQKWSGGPDCWTFTSQVGRRAGQIRQGAHLHFNAQPASRETILILPAKTLNRSLVSQKRRGTHGMVFRSVEAKIRVPFSTSTSSVDVRYCEDASHLGNSKS